MNQKDYKAISEIISIRNNVLKNNFDTAKECYEKQFSTQKYEKSVLHNTFGKTIGNILNELRKEMANKLANYFEKEEKECSDCGKPTKITEINDGIYTHHKECPNCKLGAYLSQVFNREQFLKDCGVK